MVLLLRWLVIIITSSLMLFSRGYRTSLSLHTLIILTLCLSNFILTFVPERIFSNKWFDYLFVLTDTAFVAAGIYMTGESSSEFYLVYFLVIIATTFGSDLKAIIRNTTIVSVVYTIMLFQNRPLDTVIYDEGIMLRPPFLFVMSLFYGYLAQQAKAHYSKAIDLEAEKRKLEIILEITKSVSSTLNIQEVLRIIVTKVAEYIQADRCSIILVNEQQKEGYVVASHDTPEIDRLQIDLNKYPEIFKAIESKEVVIISDINGDPLMKEVREVLNQIGIKSLMVVPISYQDIVIGTLFLKVIRKAHDFTQEDIKFCQVIANTSANAIKNAQLYEEIRVQAKTDGLTRLLNHRAFLECYQEEVIRSKRTNKPFSIIMIDVDDFKSINDSFGHQYGDRLLYELAQHLKDNTRGFDIVARYGGDEFICLLPETTHDGGLLVAKRIIERFREKVRGGHVEMTMSIGVSTYYYHTDDSALLLQLADQAMYLAKYRGGDQVFSFDPSDTQNLRSWNKKVFETFLVVKNLNRFDNRQEIAEDFIEQLRKMLSVGSSPQSLYEVVTSLSSALDARDHYTNGHSERVISYAKQIARELGMPMKHQEELVYLCLLHDIGKIGIPDHILNKPGRLTPEEFEIMKRHAEIGEKIISPIESLKSLKPLIRHHQEFYDGSGYPDGVRGEEIPLACRILAVVDTFDAMTTDRPYRKALPEEAAIAELRRCAGTQFDPMIVEVFIDILKREKSLLRSPISS